MSAHTAEPQAASCSNLGAELPGSCLPACLPLLLRLFRLLLPQAAAIPTPSSQSHLPLIPFILESPKPQTKSIWEKSFPKLAPLPHLLKRDVFQGPSFSGHREVLLKSHKSQPEGMGLLPKEEPVRWSRTPTWPGSEDRLHHYPCDLGTLLNLSMPRFPLL